MAILRDVTTFKDLMITEKNTSPRKAFRSAPKALNRTHLLKMLPVPIPKKNKPSSPAVKPVLELLEREPERIDAVLGPQGQTFARYGSHPRPVPYRQSPFYACGCPKPRSALPAGHQGVVARLFEAGFTEFADLLTDATDAPLPLILVLDQVQDPGNAGTLARTLYAMGGAGLVIPRHNGTFLGAGRAAPQPERWNAFRSPRS